MKEWIKKHVYSVIFIFFVIKMVVYYLAVNMNMPMGLISCGLTIAIFGATIYIYDHGSRRMRSALLVIYSVISVVLFIDVIYYNYFNQLVSVNQVLQIKNIKGTGDSITTAIPLFSIVLLLDLPLQWYLTIKNWKQPFIQKTRYSKPKWVSILLLAVILIIAVNPLGLSIFQRINRTEAVTAHVRDVLDSTVGKLIYQNSSLRDIFEYKSISQQTAQEVVDAVIPGADEPVTKKAYQGIGEGKNLILIQLESFQEFVIGKSYNGQELTPNLNELLLKDTINFTNYYTTMGKGNTSDAEFCTQTGLYPVIEAASYDLYIENNLITLPELMKAKGYTTSAAIGDDKTFYNRDVVYEKFGYDAFYSEETFGEGPEIGLGLSDKYVFSKMSDILSEQENPFFNFMISLSNHYPYTMDDPAEATIKLAPEDEDTLFGGYMQTIRYTDEAIGQLIADLKANGLYEDTIIVLYGDHHGLNCLDEDNYTRMTEFLGYEYDYDTMLNVPLIIHIPGYGTSETKEIVGGQVDFLPTIANLMNLDVSHNVLMGQDLLNADSGFIATVAYLLEGSFIKDGIMYEIGRDGSFEEGRAVDLNTHQPVSIEGLEEDSQKAMALIQLSKYLLEHDEAVLSDDVLADVKDQIQGESESNIDEISAGMQ